MLHPTEVSAENAAVLKEMKLTILAVKRHSERRATVSRANLHFYLDDMIGQCKGCFICSHPKTVGALGLPYVFSEGVKEIEFFIASTEEVKGP